MIAIATSHNNPIIGLNALDPSTNFLPVLRRCTDAWTTRLLAGLLLAADVDLGVRAAADQHHRQPRGPARPRGHLRDLRCHLLLPFRRDAFAVQERRAVCDVIMIKSVVLQGCSMLKGGWESEGRDPAVFCKPLTVTQQQLHASNLP